MNTIERFASDHYALVWILRLGLLRHNNSIVLLWPVH